MDTFSLHVPVPCHEAWDGMRPADGGRSCARCGHTVADLTQATDAELVAAFTRPDAPRCARFNAAQLERTLDPRKGRSGLLPVAAFTSLLAIACGNERMGAPQPMPHPEHVEVACTAADTPLAHVDTTRASSAVARTDTTELIMGEMIRPQVPKAPEPKPH